MPAAVGAWVGSASSKRLSPRMTAGDDVAKWVDAARLAGVLGKVGGEDADEEDGAAGHFVAPV
ncbi:hypothetical protein GCM10023086_75130 [Streptomyces venetus]|uniref:Uncharacterized protein n=1 Tax=Streptomyces venetus TaxID=1701086 RepID=A0ABP8HJ25_9ACTN